MRTVTEQRKALYEAQQELVKYEAAYYMEGIWHKVFGIFDTREEAWKALIPHVGQYASRDYIIMKRVIIQTSLVPATIK